MWSWRKEKNNEIPKEVKSTWKEYLEWNDFTRAEEIYLKLYSSELQEIVFQEVGEDMVDMELLDYKNKRSLDLFVRIIYSLYKFG